ncbi:DNA primase family protein [Aerosticca soli]|uniref:DNA primase/helicase, phage-associated n=1 Tax=Aerosticca soli TaxID=2010829 RepID=A0A2Z6E617_9GAMM|nr:phage/plasmid primase, P4 family [Aerosticca soli]BBD80201.1 DNA primase/helicase, phage-associated [Aerosticca soli]
MTKKRKPDLEGASCPTDDPRIAEEARRLLAEEDAAMSESELRARADAERKRLDKEHRAKRKKNAGGAADKERPTMATDDPRIAEEVRRFTEGQQQRIAEDNERNPVLPSLRTNPFGAATVVLERYFTKDDVRLLVYYREDWYQYKNQRWVLVAKKDVESALYKRLLLCRQVDAEGEIHDFVTSKPNLDTIYFQIEKNETIPSDLVLPCAREPDGSWREVDGQGCMVCRGEIVDMVSGESRPTLYTFVPNGADWRYDPNASAPKRWLQFLAELFGDKADEIAMLQEWIGYVLAGDTWAQKALLIVGPKRAGKGTIGEVLRRLLGKSMVSSPAINAIGDRFGLEDSINKRLLLVSDARLSSKKDTMAVVENLLRIVGNDPVMVDRKNKLAITDQLGVRVMMLTNTLPQFADSSDAISSRFLILQLGQSFFDQEDHRLLDKLTDELPGIALWAMEGYRRLRERGRFDEPESSKQARKDWYETGNPLAEFVKDYCVLGPDEKVDPTFFTEKYNVWRGQRKMPTVASNKVSEALKDMYGESIRRGSDGSKRCWRGIDLNEDGKNLADI